MPRFHCPAPLAGGDIIDLPPGAARHVQVLRMQPGEAITLFNGLGGEWDAAIEHMGRSDVRVRIGTHHAHDREATREIHLAVGMPANERMDWLVEKATELGVASIQPLMSERSVLRVKGDRADKKLAHWQGIAIAASEQCGRNRVPVIHDVMPLGAWLAAGQAAGQRLILSLREGSRPLLDVAGGPGAITLLSGPEGGLGTGEEDAAAAAGFAPASLGPRILRAETAALAVLAALTLNGGPAR
ncbi:MAG: 16S rRNA (uracil(1498)-N(3))-methyltransferase [Comamonadaceae bacterium]|nr:MAG: 16S rRNA (uracil(1498)-N(3))-methyltransferase [Comamonadaceae bacterium]